MNVLIVGSGGREHALAWKIGQSKLLRKLYVAPGNPGTSDVAENVSIDAKDIKKLLAFAIKTKIDMTIVGPDDPLADGIVDLFKAKGLKIFGPTKSAARIESSKSYAKNLMHKARIPTAAFRVFDSVEPAQKYLKNQTFPLFIKASGLAEGKGAVLASSLSEGNQILDEIMIQKKFGNAGDSVIIEEFLDGPEFSLHALCSSKNYIMFPSSQDHKPVFDNNQGPNTGGMGTVAPLPWVSDEEVSVLGAKTVKPVIDQLAASEPFIGLLYPGIKLTKNGPKIIEYNARFGDPETQVYMRLLDDDLLKIMVDCLEGRIEQIKPRWQKNKFAVNIAVASKGYPGPYHKGHTITGVDKAADQQDIVVFHGGTAIVGDKLISNGGRVLYVSAIGNSVKEAQKKAYAAVNLIHFEGMHFRRDIGNQALTLS